jgi:hypothetical protein
MATQSKFIPNGEQPFKIMARAFADTIAQDPARYHVPQHDADALVAAVRAFEVAYAAAYGSGSQSRVNVVAKAEARAEAERHIRRIANVVRADPRLSAAEKSMLGLRERSKRPRPQGCPVEPPRVTFKRALHEPGAVPLHELEFGTADYSSRAKPEGAVRLELFVDLVPPEDEIPAYPGANHHGRPWYLRSYTRSPVVVAPPLARVPMRVVYWGRWADAAGNVGPFSATASAWVEGGSHRPALGPAISNFRHTLPADVQVPRQPALPAREDYTVELLEARFASIHISPSVSVREELPAPPERRQLEHRESA